MRKRRSRQVQVTQTAADIGSAYLQLLQRSFRRSPRLLTLFLAIAALMLLLSTFVPPGNTQGRTIHQAKVTEILDGNQVFIQNQLVKLNAVAKQGQQVRTGKARVELTFNTGAVGRLGNNSTLTIGSSCNQLQQGSVLIEGAANGCTKSLVAGVRGTVYVMEVNKAGEESITVCDGEVSVQPVSESGLPDPLVQTLIVKPGQQIGIGQNRQLKQVRRLSRQEYDRLLEGPLFQQFKRDLKNIAGVRRWYQQLYPGARFPLDRRRPLRPGIRPEIRRFQ